VLAIGNRLGEVGTTGAPANPDDPRAEVFADQAIATLELDPAQTETVINASRVGQLSLALRSIADFTEAPGDVQRRPNSQTVRVIKYGQETNVMSGSAAPGAAAPPVIDPASYTQPPVQVQIQPATPLQ
jgi:pilus assembly protein CpaB